MGVIPPRRSLPTLAEVHEAMRQRQQRRAFADPIDMATRPPSVGNVELVMRRHRCNACPTIYEAYSQSLYNLCPRCDAAFCHPKRPTLADPTILEPVHDAPFAY